MNKRRERAVIKVDRCMYTYVCTSSSLTAVALRVRQVWDSIRILGFFVFLACVSPFSANANQF